jgi:type I restriction enzyme, S subunit
MSVETKLPEGWVECSVESLAKFIDYRGRTPKKTADGIPLITAKNIRDGFISREPREFIAEADYNDWMTRGIPNPGDVVITTEAPMGNVALIDIEEKFALAQRAICLQTYESGLGRYLHYALRSPIFQKLLTENATGTTVSGIKSATLKKLEIPLPPLAEQQVIADQLDSLLAQVEATKTRLERIPDTLKRFRQSVLADAVSGKLTQGWREGKAIETWINLTFGDLIKTGPQNGIYKPAKNYGSGKKIIRIDSFYDGYVCDFNEIKRVCIDDQELNKWKLELNDILINRVNSIEYLGKSALIRELPEPAVFESNIMRLSINTEMANPEFISIYLRSSFGTDELRKNAKLAVNQASINQGDVKACKIHLPPLPEQQEIVRRVEALFAYADRVEQQASAALVQVSQLTQSILAKAFRGELTAGWRAANPELVSGDNSAEALLARIKDGRHSVERAAQKPKKKTSTRKKI